MEFEPTVFTENEAWWFINGKWHQLTPREVHRSAGLLHAHEFLKRYPNLPRLPEEAFRTTPKLGAQHLPG